MLTSSLQQGENLPLIPPDLRVIPESISTDDLDSKWFAVRTRSRQEKVVASMLSALGVRHFLPLQNQVRQWSDRKQVISTPLFAGYLFVWMNPTKYSRTQILNIPGIAGFVGNSTGPLPIPEEQISGIQTVLNQQIECSVLPLLEEGDSVRVVRGPLAGIEGRLVQSGSGSRLLIAVDMIHRSISINIARQDVELLGSLTSQS